MSEELNKLKAQIMATEAEAFRVSNQQKILQNQYNTIVNNLNKLYASRDATIKQGVLERAKAVTEKEKIDNPPKAIPFPKPVTTKIVPQKRDSLEKP